MSELRRQLYDADDLGRPVMISGNRYSRWFRPEPNIVEGRWRCPHNDCDGYMISNGSVWPMNPPGYHHSCTACGFTAAIKEKIYD